MAGIVFVALFFGSSTAADPAIDPIHLSQAVSEGVYRNVRLPSAMPLGGLGCGSLEISSDGWFDHVMTNNNWSGYLPEPKASFLAAWVSDGDRRVCKMLRRVDRSFDSVDKVTYTGIFPHAMFAFSDDDLPVEITLDAWSPLIMWNLKDSALPGAFFTFRCSNTTDRQLDVSLCFAWENLVGAGIDLETGAPWTERNGNYQEVRDSRGVTGLVFGTTRRVSETDPLRSAIGTFALALKRQDNHSVTFLPAWDAQTNETFWRFFADDGLLVERRDATAMRPGNETVPTAGAVADRFALEPGESSEVTFVLSWHFPQVVAGDGSRREHLYSEYFDDAWDVANYMLRNRDRLWTETEQWRGALLDSSLPAWLKLRLLNDLTSVISRSILLRDRFLMIQSPPEELLESTFDAYLGDFFILCFFPELVASRLRLLAEGQSEDGEIPDAAGSIPGILSQAPPAASLVQNPLAASSFILSVRLYDQFLGDDALRAELYPAVKNAFNWLVTRDTDGDGIPEGTDPALDPNKRRNFSVTADLWLAALRCTSDLASARNDLETVSEAEKLADHARENTLIELWNGRYLRSFFDPSSPALPRAGTLCADQLLGEWFAERMGWGNLVPDEMVHTALGAILDHLRAGATGRTASQVRPPPHRQPGFRLTTPSLDGMRGEGIAPPAAVKSGVISAVASLAAYEGRAQEGLSLLYRLHRQATASGRGLSLPDFISSSGDVSDDLAGPVSWSFLQAMQGLVFDARLRRLAISPNLPTLWESARFPVFAPTFRGWVEYQAPAHEATRRISFRLEKTLDGRPLVVSQLAVRLRDPFRDTEPVLFLEGFPAGAGTPRRSLDLLILVLDEPLKIRQGEGFALLLSTKASGRIEVNVADRTFITRGPACSIDLLPDRPLSFTVTNRLQRPQVLNMRFAGLGGRSYRVAINGREVAPLEEEGSIVAFPLPSGPFGEEEQERVGWIRRRVNAMVQLLARHPLETDALREVWSLQKAVEDALIADLGGRTVFVDVYESQAKPPKRKAAKTISPAQAKRAMSELETAVDRFRARIHKVTRDPSLASRMLGLALPISLSLNVEGDPGRDAEFRLLVTISNLERIPYRGRIVIIPPLQEWSVTAGESPEVETGPSPLETLTRRFTVQMPGPASVRRMEVVARLLGYVSQQPFVLEDVIAVGHGFICDWMVLGPYPNEGDKGLAEVLFPEQEVDLGGRYKGLGGEISWRPYHSGSGYIDLTRVFEVHGPALGFAHVYLYSPRSRIVLLRLGATQGVRVVLNRKDVFTRNDHEPARPDQYLVAVNLQSGWNSLVLKVSRLRGDWGFYLEITDLEGRPVPGLRVALRK